MSDRERNDYYYYHHVNEKKKIFMIRSQRDTVHAYDLCMASLNLI